MFWFWKTVDIGCLAAEAVERAALALERVDDIERRDRLAAGVLGVRDGVADDVLKEDLEHTARLLVDEAGDALDTTTASEAAWEGDERREGGKEGGRRQDDVEVDEDEIRWRLRRVAVVVVVVR